MASYLRITRAGTRVGKGRPNKDEGRRALRKRGRNDAARIFPASSPRFLQRGGHAFSPPLPELRKTACGTQETACGALLSLSGRNITQEGAPLPKRRDSRRGSGLIPQRRKPVEGECAPPPGFTPVLPGILFPPAFRENPGRFVPSRSLKTRGGGFPRVSASDAANALHASGPRPQKDAIPEKPQATQKARNARGTV